MWNETVNLAMNDIAGAPVAIDYTGERTVLVVEDDRSFLQRLAKALEQKKKMAEVYDDIM